MVDKCLQNPPPFSIPTQQLDISTGPQLLTGQTIEDQLNSKGEPPEESLPLNAIRRGLSKAHQVMSFNGGYVYEGRVVGDKRYERMAEEAALKIAESDDKLNEEEVKSMASGKSKSTVKSTAEDWFKDFNGNVQEYNKFAGYDDDPPYYQPNDSLRRKHQLGFKQSRPHKLSRISPSGAVLRGRRVGGEGMTEQSSQSIVNELAVSTEMMGTGGVVESTSDSNSDSYRSVIDDLTIKNQKLKRRLRKLEELQAEHLQTDKVFELRIHGLSQSKRQELENLLQQFTSTLNNSPGSSGPSLTDSLPATSTGSSFGPSTVVTSDSAYASNVDSGTVSLAAASTHQSLASGKSGDSRHSKGSWNAGSSGRGTASSGSSGGVNGKKVPTYISEKTKMKQVVRRLEYLFTGKRSQDQHLAPNWQQSKAVSSDTDDIVGTLEGQEGVKEKPAIALDDSPAKSPELDSRLPQIPEQNVEYLHNLTSISPTHEPLAIGGHWDGWVYLNLVINLAQLHTINVTVPFVKKAIATMSVKLELSPDGKMVRWKGGMEGSNLPNEGDTKSENSSSSPSSSPMDASSEASRGRKRSDGSYSQTDISLIAGMPIDPKMSHSMETSSTRLSTLSRSQDSGPRSSPSSQSSSGFHYKPLFAQSKNFDDDSSEPSETGYSSSSGMKSSSSPDGVSGDYSGGGSRTRGKKPTVGPIIYYENGKFCTDLSAQEVIQRDESTTPEYPYERMTNEVVGAPGSENTDAIDQNSRPLLRTLAPLETLVEGQLLGGRPRGASGSTDEDEDDDSYNLEFSPKLESTLPDDPPLPVELEASGIGGVQPEDNFAINVQVKHFLLPKGRNAQTINTRKLKSKLRGITHRIPQSSIDVFLRDEAGMGALPTTRPRSRSSSTSPSPPRSSSSDGRPSPEPLRHELVSARFIRLPPSSLPPASYMYFSPSSDESRSDSDSGLNSSSQSDSYAESQINDGLTDDGQDILGNKHIYGGRAGSRRSAEDYMEEGSSTVSSRMSGSIASSNLVVGRVAPFPPDSSAATAGSGCESMEGIDEDDDEDISENDATAYYHKNDSDEIMDDFGPDDESLDGAEDSNMRNPKRNRDLKSSIDSIPAMRNSKNAI